MITLCRNVISVASTKLPKIPSAKKKLPTEHKNLRRPKFSKANRAKLYAGRQKKRPLTQVSTMSSQSDSQNRSDSIREESVAGNSVQFSDGEEIERLRKRRGKLRVESTSSSEKTVEEGRALGKENLGSSPRATSRPPPVVNPVWEARPPLPMINVPRVSTDTVRSEIRPGELERIRIAYHIPKTVEIAVPTYEFRATRPPVGWWCCYEDQMKGGLRFPLHPFLLRLLNHYKVPLAQVVPNGIRIIIRFLLACLKQEVTPTIELFRYFFQMKKAAQTGGYIGFSSRGGLRITTPDNNSGWKPRFLFFRLTGALRMAGPNLREEWNFNVEPDRLPNRDLLKPTGRVAL